MQTELNYKYLDEIKRLQKIIDENGLIRSEDEGEENTKEKRRRPHQKASNRGQSIDSVDYEPYKRIEPLDPRKADEELKSRIQASLQKKVTHVKIRTDEVAPEVVYPQLQLPATLEKKVKQLEGAIGRNTTPNSSNTPIQRPVIQPTGIPLTVHIRRTDKEKLKDNSITISPSAVIIANNPVIGPLKEMKRLDSRGSNAEYFGLT